MPTTTTPCTETFFSLVVFLSCWFFLCMNICLYLRDVWANYVLLCNLSFRIVSIVIWVDNPVSLSLSLFLSLSHFPPTTRELATVLIMNPSKVLPQFSSAGVPRLLLCSLSGLKAHKLVVLVIKWKVGCGSGGGGGGGGVYSVLWGEGVVVVGWWGARVKMREKRWGEVCGVLKWVLVKGLWGVHCVWDEKGWQKVGEGFAACGGDWWSSNWGKMGEGVRE